MRSNSAKMAFKTKIVIDKTAAIYYNIIEKNIIGAAMKRDILDKLVSWKNSADRKPLVLKGVRQCGKTFILKEFGEKHYSDVAYYNFEEMASLADIFERDFDVQRILFELGLVRGKTIAEGATLIIFDEIQECGRALTSLKYFCENARGYHIACAGSLLGIALNENRSFPVGKVDFLTLYPMSFYEFLAATGNESSAEYLAKFEKGNKLPEALALKLSSSFKEYLLVGGMPEAVEAWRTTHDIEKVETIQQQILSSYELDFAKHATSREFPKLSAIWASIPQQLSKPNRKFIFSQVKKGWRAKDLEDSLRWLIAAGLIYKVDKIEKPFIPLSSYADASTFKIYLSDVGLLRRLAKVPPQVVLESSGIFTEFKGAMAENYVLNELIKSGGDAPYYWSSANSAEVDFIVQCGVHVVPVEVKSSTNVKARSLAEYRRRYAPDYSVKTSLLPDVGGETLLDIPLSMIASMRNFAGE